MHLEATPACSPSRQIASSSRNCLYTLDIIVNDDSLWITDLKPLRFVKLDFAGNHLYTWLVPSDLPDGYLEVHAFSVDSAGNLYGGDNQYGRTQKFVPKPGANSAHLIRAPWVAK